MGKPMGKPLGGPIGALYPNALGSNPSVAVANTAMRPISEKRTLYDRQHKRATGPAKKRRRNEGLLPSRGTHGIVAGVNPGMMQEAELSCSMIGRLNIPCPKTPVNDQHELNLVLDGVISTKSSG